MPRCAPPALIATAGAIAIAIALSLAVPARIQAQTRAQAQAQAHTQHADSRLHRILKSGVLRVCVWPLYFAIAMEDPRNHALVGIDADLSNELAHDMGVTRQIVESTFGTFIADLQADRCDIAMFGIGATMRRAQRVAFSHPYLIASVRGVVRAGSPIERWADIDKTGIRVGVYRDSYMEPIMRAALKNATLLPPAATQIELLSNRADVVVTDFASALRIIREYAGSRIILPPEKLGVVPYAYAVPQGDQIWLNYVNLFVDTIKLDGRLAAAAARHGLSAEVAP